MQIAGCKDIYRETMLTDALIRMLDAHWELWLCTCMCEVAGIQSSIFHE